MLRCAGMSAVSALQAALRQGGLPEAAGAACTGQAARWRSRWAWAAVLLGRRARGVKAVGETGACRAGIPGGLGGLMLLLHPEVRGAAGAKGHAIKSRAGGI